MNSNEYEVLQVVQTKWIFLLGCRLSVKVLCTGFVSFGVFSMFLPHLFWRRSVCGAQTEWNVSLAFKAFETDFHSVNLSEAN